MPLIYRILHGILLWIARLIGLFTLFFLLQYSTIPLGSEWSRATLLTRNHLFDYITWEANAILAKLGQTLTGVQPFMSEAERSQYVRTYMADLSQAQALENQITLMYADATIEDAAHVTASLRAERDALRMDLRSRQTLAEAILEGQVASVLVDLGFQTAGQLIPPISMRFSEMPNVLIISPRESIQFEMSLNLYPMPVDDQIALEEQIDEALDVSSLIAPLGGIALYPAMIIETTSIQYALETFAHEWVHHYLFMYPLGLNYDFDSETRIINETTASIFGRAVGRLVMIRYYPDLLPPEPMPTPTTDANAPPMPTPTQDPQVFDFGREMNETRVTVDAMLTAGEVEEAEAYMEARRQLFVENGFLIRKLNQAYFAFYGGYQSGVVSGVGGTDPIGPALEMLLANSDSLYTWIEQLRGITTREELLRLVP